MSQSTLSRHIRALEREIGTSLFTRDNQTALTFAGKILLEEAGRMFTVEERLMRRIAEASRAVQGKLRLEDYFFSQSIKNFMLMAARRYRSMYPGVGFEFVHVGSGSSIEGLLRDDRLDVGVLVHTGPEVPWFSEGDERVVALWHERSRMGIYMRDSDLRPGDVVDGEIRLEVLKRLPIVLPLRPEYANFRADMSVLCAAHGFEASFKLIEMSSLEDLALLDMDGCAQIVLESDLRDPASPFLIDTGCTFRPIREVCWATPYLLLAPRVDEALLASFRDFLNELAEEYDGGRS